MAMLKIWEDRYINTRLIDQVFITSEKGVMDDCILYNVDIQLNTQEGNIWLGQFDTFEGAQESVEELFEELIEFVPTYN